MFFQNRNANKLSYESFGKGPPLIILGGLGDSARNWRSLAQGLAQNHHIIVLEHRDSGQSFRAQSDYTIDDMTSDVYDLCEHLKIKEAALLGFSMGGKIALNFAAHHSSCITKLILLSTSPSLEGASEQARKVLSHPQETDEYAEEQFKILYGQKYQEKVPASAFIKFKKLNPHPQDPQAHLRQLWAIQNFDGNAVLKKISCPTLILAGDNDPICPTQISQDLSHKIKTATLKIYTDTGHLLQAEQPKVFQNDVLDFLQDQ